MCIQFSVLEYSQLILEKYVFGTSPRFMGYYRPAGLYEEMLRNIPVHCLFIARSVDLLTPYYTMRFPYVALAIRPNAN